MNKRAMEQNPSTAQLFIGFFILDGFRCRWKSNCV